MDDQRDYAEEIANRAMLRAEGDSEVGAEVAFDAEQRVALGVVYVEERGYSLTEIDLDTFDIRGNYLCVLGQLNGSYRATVDGWGLSYQDCERAGFTCRELESDDPETMALQAEWHRVIAAAQGRDIPWRLFPTE